MLKIALVVILDTKKGKLGGKTIIWFRMYAIPEIWIEL